MTPTIDPDASLRWAPAQGRPEQLMILLHGANAGAASLQPLAEALRRSFPQALLLAWQLAWPQPGLLAGAGSSPTPLATGALASADLPDNPLDDLSPGLQRWRAEVHQAQQASGVGPAATALVGCGDGALLALELSAFEDGLAGRVLAFGGCYARLPARAPRATTLHFFHAAGDPMVPVQRVRETLQHLGALQGDATLDIANGVGHALAPALVQCALQRLQTHIPHRTWAAALGAVPGLAERLPHAHDDPEP